MKIYFGASVKGKYLYANQHRSIVQAIEALGHIALFDNFFDINVTEVENQTREQKIKVHEKLGKLKLESDIVVIECSYRSFALGQEIAHAFRIGKPVLALYTDGQFPHLILTDAGDRLLVSEYNINTLKQVIADGINFLNPQETKRFTMNISAAIIDYMDRITREHHISRSDYIRNLIVSDIQKVRNKKT